MTRRPDRIVRRLVGLIAIGFLLLGCGSGPPPDGFELLTGPLGCYAGGERGAAGTLEVDSEYGTRFNGIPVMWPAGFTGVRVGDEVEVHDASGTAIATTGRKYYISVAYADRARDMLERLGIDAYPAAANCGYPWDFVDCSRPATGQPGLAEPEAACAGIGARRGVPHRVA
jgi:hypothetical protein